MTFVIKLLRSSIQYDVSDYVTKCNNIGIIKRTREWMPEIVHFNLELSKKVEDIITPAIDDDVWFLYSSSLYYWGFIESMHYNNKTMKYEITTWNILQQTQKYPMYYTILYPLISAGGIEEYGIYETILANDHYYVQVAFLLKCLFQGAGLGEPIISDTLLNTNVLHNTIKFKYLRIDIGMLWCLNQSVATVHNNIDWDSVPKIWDVIRQLCNILHLSIHFINTQYYIEHESNSSNFTFSDDEQWKYDEQKLIKEFDCTKIIGNWNKTSKGRASNYYIVHDPEDVLMEYEKAYDEGNTNREKSLNWMKNIRFLKFSGSSNDWINELQNPDFEDYPGSGSNAFVNWVDQSAEVLAQIADTSIKHTGNVSCKLTQINGSEGGVKTFYSIGISVDETVCLTFYTRGNGSYAGYYRIRDITNGIDLIAKTSTGVTGTGWTRISVYFTNETAGSIFVDIYFYAPNTNDQSAWFDTCDVSRKYVSAFLSDAEQLGKAAEELFDIYCKNYKQIKITSPIKLDKYNPLQNVINIKDRQSEIIQEELI